MRARSAKLLAAVWAFIDDSRDEISIAFALTLLTAGLWPQFGQAALVAPGLILTWLYLPQRVSLIQRPKPEPERRKR